MEYKYVILNKTCKCIYNFELKNGDKMIKRSKEEILAQIKKRGVKKSFLCELIGGYRGKLTEWEKGKTTLTDQELNIITDYLFNNDSIQSKATALYEKYSKLDNHGKNLVNTIIDKEYERCIRSQSPDSAQFSDNDVIETSKGSYKVAHAAAFGGGTMDILIPANASPDEINRLIDENKTAQRRKKNEEVGNKIIDAVNKNK